MQRAARLWTPACNVRGMPKTHDVLPRLRHALTVDVEDWYQVSAFDEVLSREDWDAQAQRVHIGTERLLALCARHGTRGTFFVLGWVAERHPGLIRAIHDTGHEIASHGHAHRLVHAMDAETFRADLRRASDAIHAACGVRPRGFRAPSFSAGPETPWMWEVLADEGYTYSSSVFPVRHDRYGAPDFPRHPVQIETAAGRIWEFPMTTWRVLGRNVPAAGGGWLRALPPVVMRRALRAAETRRTPGIVYVHPWELDPEQPAMPGVGRRATLRHRIGLHRTEDRLGHLLAAFRFAPVRQVLEHLGEAATIEPTPVDRLTPSRIPAIAATRS